jgi:hypothetical protein
VVVLRYYGPYHCEPMFYTSKLWENGSDSFVNRNGEHPEKVKICLYEWIHLRNVVRLDYLLNYARSMDVDELSLFKDPVHEKTGTEQTVRQEVSQAGRKMAEYQFEEELRPLGITRKFGSCFGRCCRKAKKAQKQSDEVVCIFEYRGYKEVLRKEHGQTGVSHRIHVPVYIKEHAHGKVLGRTPDGRVAVRWDKNMTSDESPESEHVVELLAKGEDFESLRSCTEPKEALRIMQHLGDSQRCEPPETVPSIDVAIDPKHIEEYDLEWLALKQAILALALSIPDSPDVPDSRGVGSREPLMGPHPSSR